MRSKGYGTRFDDDGSGNHIDRLRMASKPSIYLPSMKFRVCDACKLKKPKKGASPVQARPWLCADCKAQRAKCDQAAAGI